MSSIDAAVVEPTLLLDRLAPRLTKRPLGHGMTTSVIALSIVATVAAFLAGVSLAGGGHATGLSLLAERPLAVLQTIAGLSACSLLLLLPAIRGLSRLWVKQEVRVGTEFVEILRHTPFGIARRSVPLNAYQGLAHHIRASLSGLSHEIVLVHSDSSLTVTLLSAERVTQALLDEYKTLLRLPEIPASAIYGHSRQAVSVSIPTTFSPASA